MAIKRRQLIKGTLGLAAGSALTLGFVLPGKSFANSKATPQSAAIFTPNAFVRIGTEGDVTVIVGQAEMGQNVYTTLPMIVAEELDIDPTAIRIEQSGVAEAYNSTFLPIMMTGGSSSVNSNYERLRQAGATARAMLISAAATEWGVDAAKLKTANGAVIHPTSGEQKSYSSLAMLAATLPVPADVQLKSSDDFRYIGKGQKRLDSGLKTTGKALFAIDARPADLHYAMVARASIFGATVKSVDDATARAMPGVVKIKPVPSGIAVIATSTWHARQARDALKIVWNEGEFAGKSSAALRAEYRAIADTAGYVVKQEGDALEKLQAATAAKAPVINVVYEFPFLAHACMEPMNCTVHDQAGKAVVWAGSQMQTGDRASAATILGCPPDSVEFNEMFLGGGFGRRATFGSDVVSEAAHVAKGEAWPVQTVWTREDDMRGGYYRPMYTHRSRLCLDEQGNPLAWYNCVVGQMMTGMENFVGPDAKFDGGQTEGLSEIPYELPNFQLEAHLVKSPVTTLWWRSVGNTHTAFVKETMIDEAANAAGKDPLAYRKSLLGAHPRQQALLDKVRDMSGWGRKLPTGTGLGVAIHESFGSIVAEVAEVQVTTKGIQVHKVWCAVDCGFAVNPLGVAAQMESAVVFALTAALFGEITIDKGAAKQSNFHDYPMVRMDQAPQVDVAIINSGAAMGGIGEPGTPPLFPAVGNAIYAATGKRLRSLPFGI